MRGALSSTGQVARYAGARLPSDRRDAYVTWDRPGTKLTPEVKSKQQPSAARTATSTSALVSSASLLRLQAVTLAHTDFATSSAAFCGELAEIADALRVSLGLLDRRHSKLLALSKGAPAQLDRALSRQLLATMDEACDQGSTVTAPSGSLDRRINRAAELLRRQHHGIVICVPIAVQQTVLGAIVIELADPQRVTAPLIALVEDAAALFGPILELMRRNERSLLQRLRDQSRALRRNWPRHLRSPWRWLAIAVVLSLAALAIIPSNYTVSAPARVEGAIQRVVAAPANGFLKSSAVRPGDPVKQGQVLAELLDRDLQLDRIKLQGESAQHENAYAASMAKADRPNMMIYQAKLAETKAQMDLIDQQIKRVQMQAPIDGVVIQGDLTQMLGSPVEKGQVLMTIAPRNAFRIMVELDERDIQLLKVGQRGSVSLSALPWDQVAITIERITPMATVLDGRNVFEIEAHPLPGVRDLRPGLRGVARVEVGREPLLQVWSRRLAEHVRRFVWRWSP